MSGYSIFTIVVACAVLASLPWLHMKLNKWLACPTDERWLRHRLCCRGCGRVGPRDRDGLCGICVKELREIRYEHALRARTVDEAIGLLRGDLDERFRRIAFQTRSFEPEGLP